MLDLQAKALDPRKANKLNDLQKVLTEWRHTRQQVKDEDPSFVLTDKQLRAILFKILPEELLPEMRRKVADGRYEGDYLSLEQALFDEVDTRKMDEENRQKTRIGAVVTDPSESSEEYDHDYHNVKGWSDALQAHIDVLVPMSLFNVKRDSPDDDVEGERAKKARKGGRTRKATRAKEKAARQETGAGNAVGLTLPGTAPSVTAGRANFRIPPPGHLGDLRQLLGRRPPSGASGCPSHGSRAARARAAVRVPRTARAAARAARAVTSTSCTMAHPLVICKTMVGNRTITTTTTTSTTTSNTTTRAR